ncbi:short-chain dehydrogenase [Endozoicomonas sp. (ex Bugula neritina AB1)]|nr:short-chain dehydrogenase [Endozoicomonas sp. (ex Bugula neritina AB1)]
MARVVVIIGANRGLGLEFCRQYLKQGDKVFACCRTPENAQELLKLKQRSNGMLETVPLDVNNELMLRNLPHVIDSPVDILIHNAGVYGPRHSHFDQVGAEEWMEVLRTNTVAPLMVVQALINQLAQGHEKKLILLSSKMGSVGDNQKGGSYIYRSSKAALNAVGKSLAVDLADQGIKVAIVHPGWVQTDMGGSQALINTETSITGLCQIIESLTSESSGTFFSYDGSIIPW